MLAIFFVLYILNYKKANIKAKINPTKNKSKKNSVENNDDNENYDEQSSRNSFNNNSYNNEQRTSKSFKPPNQPGALNRQTVQFNREQDNTHYYSSDDQSIDDTSISIKETSTNHRSQHSTNTTQANKNRIQFNHMSPIESASGADDTPQPPPARNIDNSRRAPNTNTYAAQPPPPKFPAESYARQTNTNYNSVSVNSSFTANETSFIESPTPVPQPPPQQKSKVIKKVNKNPNKNDDIAESDKIKAARMLRRQSPDAMSTTNF